MDAINLKDKITGLLHRFRYGILVIAIGLVLMSIPGREEVQETPPVTVSTQTGYDTEDNLAKILSQIYGVGKVEVMLTVAAGEQTVYEVNEDRSNDTLTESVRVETVLITGENRAQQGLVQQVISPIYQGAIIVCQGGDQPSVQLAVVEAVSDVTGLTADKITVLKMK